MPAFPSFPAHSLPALSAKAPLGLPGPRLLALVAALIATALLAAAAMLLSSLLSFETVEPALHRWAPPGAAARYTRAVHEAFMPRFRLLALVTLLGGTAAWRFRDHIAGIVLSATQSLRQEMRQLLLRVWAMPWSLASMACLLALCVVAAAIRWVYLFQPMRYDEATTYLGYACNPVYLLVCKYDFPNNHIFHSLCVHLSTKLLGDAAWAIRLPAFLAGLLLIPACYGAAYRLYGRQTAWLSGCLVAGSSMLIEYSTNARGYTLVALCFLLMLTVASLVLEHKSLLGWGSLTLLGVVGFWTVPIMLFPYGIVMLWLGLSGLRSEQTRALYGRSFLAYLAGSMLLTIVLTTLAYAPVLMVSGPEALVGNRFVKPLGWSRLWREAPLGLLSTWTLWCRDMPLLLQCLLVGGLCLTLVRHGRIAAHSISVIVVAVLWCLLLVVVQRINPFERVWLFALPLYLMAASAGLIHLLTCWGGSSRRWLIPAVCAAGLALPGWNTLQSHSVEQSLETGILPDADELTAMLKGQLNGDDRVLSRCPSDAPLEYYFRKEGVPTRYLIEWPDLPRWQGSRLFVVVNRLHGQTLQELNQRYHLADVVDLLSARLVYECPSAHVFLLTR